MKFDNTNFHGKLHLQKFGLHNLLKVIADFKSCTLEEFSARSKLPQGKSSGKVMSFSYYAEYCGLIDCDINSGNYKANLTDLGKAVLNNDPFLLDPKTHLLLYLVISSKVRGNVLFHTFVNKVIPSLNQNISFEIDSLRDDFSRADMAKTNFDAVSNFFLEFDRIPHIKLVDKKMFIEALPLSTQFLPIVENFLLYLWANSPHKDAEQISITQILSMGFHNYFRWTEGYLKRYLEEICEYSTRLNIQTQPNVFVRRNCGLKVTLDVVSDGVYSC